MTATAHVALTFVSVFALIAVVLAFDIKYAMFRRYARSRWFIGIAAVGAVVAVFADGYGRTGLYLLVPYLQLLLFTAFASLYRSAAGRDLDERPLTPFLLEGRFALGFFDLSACAITFAVSAGIFRAYDVWMG